MPYSHKVHHLLLIGLIHVQIIFMCASSSCVHRLYLRIIIVVCVCIMFLECASATDLLSLVSGVARGQQRKRQWHQGRAAQESNQRTTLCCSQ